METLKGTVRNNVNFKDFAKVFKTFETFPFFEKWTEEALIDEYKSFQDDGIILGYYTEDGKCVAILTMKPYTHGKHQVYRGIQAKHSKLV